MKCLICRHAELVSGLTSIQLERSEMQFVINNIPARVCPACGDAYVEEQVAAALLLQAAQISETGVLDGVFEYNTLS